MFCKCFLALLLSHNGLVSSFGSIIGQLFVTQLKTDTMSRALALKLIKTIFIRVFSNIKGSGQITTNHHKRKIIYKTLQKKTFFGPMGKNRSGPWQSPTQKL